MVSFFRNAEEPLYAKERGERLKSERLLEPERPIPRCKTGCVTAWRVFARWHYTAEMLHRRLYLLR